MTSLQIFSLFSFLILITHKSKVAATCPISYCDATGPIIRFPFKLNYTLRDPCGYPGFGLSCSKTNQTIITLPSSGDFVVTDINYRLQYLFINDPNNCLPKRLQNLTLDDTPFRVESYRNFFLLNCSSNLMTQIPQSRPVPCLGVDPNYTILSVPEEVYGYYPTPVCTLISTARSSDLIDLSDDIMLRWNDPDCWSCERQGGVCRVKDNLEIECYNPYNGTPRYRIIIGILVPGCLCIVLLLCYYYTWARNRNQRHVMSTDFQVSVTELPVIVRGLDDPTIESYPKTQLGESKRLPNPCQNTCAVCLSEYKPKEILKTIPECNHYFHAQCIDQWLKMNSTCPLCRNSPGRFSQGTPTSISSSPSSSLLPN